MSDKTKNKVKVTRTKEGNKIIVKFELGADKAIIISKFEKTAEYLFNRGVGDHGTIETPRTFLDLSETEKDAIVGEWLIEGLLTMTVAGISDKVDKEKNKEKKDLIAVENEITFDDIQ